MISIRELSNVFFMGHCGGAKRHGPSGVAYIVDLASDALKRELLDSKSESGLRRSEPRTFQFVAPMITAYCMQH